MPRSDPVGRERWAARQLACPQGARFPRDNRGSGSNKIQTSGWPYTSVVSRLGRSWLIALTLGLIGILAFSMVWAEDPLLFVSRSPPAHLLGIDRFVTGNATAFVQGNMSSGCSSCPLTILAGSTVTVEIGFWNANATSAPGETVAMSWSVVSPYPFDAPVYAPPTPPMVYSWHDCDTVGPYGNGGWGLSLTIVIPYADSGLPSSGSVNFTMTATAGGPCS